jgi:hypothetical protein
LSHRRVIQEYEVRRHILITIGAATLIGSPALGGLAHAEPAPLGTVTVNPASTGTEGDVLVPLAGDSSWLVYIRSTQVVGNTASDPSEIQTNTGPVTVSDYAPSRIVQARSASGKVETISTVRTSDGGWSVVGNYAVAQRASGSGLDWWNLKTNHHGVVSGNRFTLLGAAPGGTYFFAKGSTLKRRSFTTRETISYGTVLSSYGGGVSGPHGILVGRSDEKWAYVRYARPHRVTRLKTTATDGDPVACTTIDASSAACYRFSDDDDAASPSADLVVPLSGKRPTVSTTCAGYPSIARRTAVWASGEGGLGSEKPSCVEGGSHLVSIAAGGKPASSPTLASALTTSADGKAVFASNTNDSLLGATRATSSSTIFSTPPSRTTVGAFALSAGRITDTDDAPDAAHPTHRVSVRTHPLSSDGDAVTVGTGSVGSGDIDSPVDGRFVSASGVTTAYLIPMPTATGGYSLRIDSPAGNTTIEGVIPQSVTTSGNRVLYAKDPGTALAVHWFNADLAAGTTTEVGTDQLNDFGHFALWGTYLVSLNTANTAVVRTNLATGATTQVEALSAHEAADGFQIVGDRVLVTSNCTATIFDLATSTTTTMKACGEGFPLELTSVGVVYRNGSDWTLRRWSGNDVTLLGVDRTLALVPPQIEGGAFAWLTTASNLDVAPINIPDPAPRYLGAAIAPTTATADGSHTWTTSIPYTAPLTSCSVTVTQAATPVRTLSCNSMQAGQGAAAVTWDGRDSDGNLVADGSYTWTVEAAGSGGSALDASGGSSAVSGIVTVSH